MVWNSNFSRDYFYLDDEPLAEPRPLSPEERLRVAKEHFEDRFPHAEYHLKLFSVAAGDQQRKHAAFELHQALEQAYSCVLPTLTNYDPHSHNIKFLRALAEEQDRRLAGAWPRDERRFIAWFNTLKEAYVKARYSKHFKISEEALAWLGERTAALHRLVETACREHLKRLERMAGDG